MNRQFRIGTFAAVALALGIFATACGDDDDDSGSYASLPGDGDAAVSTDRFAPDESPARANGVSEEAAGGGTTAPGSVASQFDRKIIFNAAVSLEAADVPAVFAAAGRVATLNGGFVEGSSLSGAGSEGDRRSATVTLRVPSENYQDALEDLRGINGVDVVDEHASSAEVTEEYTDLESRLRNLERTEQQYLGLMEKAATIDDILTVSDRLDSVRLQIEQVQGRLNYLDNLAGMATIDVSIIEPLPAKASSSGDTSIGEAFADAWELSLEGARAFAIAAAYIAVAVGWIVIPAGLVLLAVRKFRHPANPAA